MPALTTQIKQALDSAFPSLRAKGQRFSALVEESRHRVAYINIENLAAGADIAARAEFVAPTAGCELVKISIVPKAASADIDDSNTAVIAIADKATNAIVSKTYNTATQPPAAGVAATLGNLDSTHRVLTANEVVTVAVTQGTSADLPAFILVFEYETRP
jgi:hypothetical protein